MHIHTSNKLRITITSWERRRLKSPASLSFAQARIKETSKLRATGLCAGNSPVTGEFPTQMTSDAENVLIWWRHHELNLIVIDVC